MTARYYYITEDGSISASGDVRIDSPDPESAYYGTELSHIWKPWWFARIDGTVYGYPSGSQDWNFTSEIWFFTKEYLKQAARTIRLNAENNSTVFYQGYNVPASIGNLSLNASLAQISRLQNPTETTGVRYDGSKNSVSMTNADFVGLVDATLNHLQAIIDAEVQVVALIEDETITDVANIDAAFTTAMENPFQHINPITDLYNTINDKATPQDIADAISNLVGGAGAAMDTLGEIATLFSDNSDVAAALATTVANKVDKVAGKELSTNDYSDIEKSKVAGIAQNATSNSPDIALLNRVNHVGEQLISTITGLQSALDDKQNIINAGAHIDNAEADINAIHGLPDALVALAEANEKFNTLLAVLESQGLLESS